MVTQVLDIESGHAYIHWKQCYPSYDEFDWDRYNDCIDRLIAKTARRDIIVAVNVKRIPSNPFTTWPK